MFGIQMFTLRDFVKTPEDYENTLKRVAEMGYQNVQITPPPHSSFEQTAALLKKHGLKADSAFHTLYGIEGNGELIAKNTAALGTDVVRTDSIRPEFRTTKEGYLESAALLNRCGAELKRQGLKFMYHFHAFEFIKLGDTRGIDILLGETDPELVLFQPDVFWLTAAGCEPSEELKRFKNRVLYMHMKDYVVTTKKTDILEEISQASAPVGTGNLNWDVILKTAKDIGVINFVVEDDMGILNPFESAAQSIANMKKLGF